MSCLTVTQPSAGSTITPFRGIYTVWTTTYFAGSPAQAHVAAADGVDLGVSSNTVGYNVAPDPHPLSLFAFAESNFNFEGEFAELIVYDGILSSADRDAVELYLRERAGEPTGLDLSNGTVIQYEFGCQPDANWIVGPAGRTLDQLTNADASIYLLDQESAGVTLTGRLASGTAPDFMGFVFGYQNRGQYYLFDWKKTAADFCGGSTSEGMRLRVVDVSGGADPGGAEMWGDPASTNITTLASNDIPWAANVDYNFELTMENGVIDLELRDGATVLESWNIADSTYTNGQFGLYINSLQDVVFGPIRVEQQPSPPTLPIPLGTFWLVFMLTGVVLLARFGKPRR